MSSENGVRGKDAAAEALGSSITQFHPHTHEESPLPTTYRGSDITCLRCIPMTGWLVHEKRESWNSAAVQQGRFLFSTGHLDNVWRDVTVTTGRWYYWQVGRGQGCCETSYKAQDRNHKMSAALRWNFAITDETWYFVCCCIQTYSRWSMYEMWTRGNTMHNRTFETALETLTSWFFCFPLLVTEQSFPPNELKSSYPILWVYVFSFHSGFV